jgi:hypothetical protein
MKREWEELEDSDVERNYLLAGLTQQTIDKITAWIENAAKDQK